MTGSLFLFANAAMIVTAFALASCEPESRDSQRIKITTEAQEKIVREAGDVLTKALASTQEPLPTDAIVLGEFRANRQDYEAVAKYVRANADLTRFDLSMEPPGYDTFSGREGPLAELDPKLTQLLLKGTLPDIIDGDLRSHVPDPELRFVNYRSGTVVAGASKGVSFAPGGALGPVLDSLDELDAVRDAVRSIESGCAYRRIDDDWYVSVCI